MVGREEYVRGEVDHTGRAIINPNHPAILKRMQEGREIARNIMRRMGAKKTSDLAKPVELHVTGITGTPGPCRGGSDRSNSVVNSAFECHDIEKLFICDNSVIPKLGSTENYGAATAMMACHAWRQIVANHFRA